MGTEQGVVEVRYSGEYMVLWSVIRKHEQCSASENYTFKVLRTPDQIAAEEREKEDIRSLASAIHKHAVYCRLPMSDFGAESLAMHLYADGCRVAE